MPCRAALRQLLMLPPPPQHAAHIRAACGLLAGKAVARAVGLLEAQRAFGWYY
jgi:hypothetical protein